MNKKIASVSPYLEKAIKKNHRVHVLNSKIDVNDVLFRLNHLKKFCEVLKV